MFCGRCGGQVAEGSAACGRCGAPAGRGPASPATAPPLSTSAAEAFRPGTSQANTSPAGGPDAATQGFSFDGARLSQADRIAGAASVVLLVSLFLPWFTASAGPFGSASASGITAHGYLWVVFLLCLGIVAFLVVGSGFVRLPVSLPAARETILLAATGLNLLIVLLAFSIRPNGFGVLSIGWAFGAFVALIAAIAACAPLAVPVLRAYGER
jgi:hypothetical protein